MVVTAILFFLIFLVAFLVFFFCFKKLRWMLSVILLAVLVFTYYPASELMAQYIWDLNTFTGEVDTVHDLPSELSGFMDFIPVQCQSIHYKSTIASGWFSCNISAEEFKQWAELKEFKPNENSQCFTAEQEANKLFPIIESIAKFSTPMESNGAGKTAFYSAEQKVLLACEWYW